MLFRSEIQKLHHLASKGMSLAAICKALTRSEESVKIRAKAEIVDGPRGEQIVVTEIPYQTSVDAIADAAGVARRTVYHHFKTKNDILVEASKGAAMQAFYSGTGTEPYTTSPADLGKALAAKMK